MHIPLKIPDTLSSSTPSIFEHLVFREVDRALWPDLERFFEARGGPHYCWCMLWRVMGEERKHTDPANRKADLKKRVDAGIPVGILAYLEGTPIAWCSLAPRTTYRPLGGLIDPLENPAGVWSVVCFHTARAWRNKGIMSYLIRGSIAHASARGAQVLEAYPVDPEAHSYRFMGYVTSFTAAGFREVGRAGTRRHVMRLELI
jgi:GNAT superfamily N-acetyltransferase